MEMYLFEPARFEQLYNCSMYSVDQVPLEERRQVLLGTLSILIFIVFELLYIPCVPALWRHSEQSCYKIMFFISLVDILGMVVASLITGILGIQGIVYCSNPVFGSVIGLVGNFLYSLETTASVLLAASRCLELSFPNFANTLFGGRRTWYWIGLVCLYASCFCFFDKLVLFNSISFGWLFNPHVGYINGIDEMYTSLVDLVHECCVIALTFLFYSLFIISLIKNRYGCDESVNVQNTKKIVILQIFLISCMNSMITTAYIMLYIVEVNPIVFMILGTFGWQLLHALPPLIYLSVNRTLRKECIQIVKRLGCWKQIRPKNNFKNTTALHILPRAQLIPIEVPCRRAYRHSQMAN